jgi:hypothetical protein
LGVAFESDFDTNFPGFFEDVPPLDLEYSLEVATRVLSLPAREKPVSRDRSDFVHLRIKKGRDLIKRGISLLGYKLPLERGSFSSLHEIAESEMLQPDPKEAESEPTTMDVEEGTETHSTPSEQE